MSDPLRLAQRREEFEQYMWNHAADEFQAKFDQRRRLSVEELTSLRSVGDALRSGEPKEYATAMTQAVATDPDFILILLQLTGLTRNKILQDLKATALDDRKIIVPSGPITLPKRAQVWALALAYLRPRIERVLKPVLDMDGPVRDRTMEALNQATWSGYIRQERAKRQGHEAEYRLATMFKNVGLPFVPEEKAENPLCADIQIDGVSYDLVVPTVEDPVLVVKSTVHTANIGQYGESKDALEVREAVQAWVASGSKNPPVLLALIDGLGFRSNRAGLNGVLTEAGEFCQFRTLWKAAVVAAHRLRQPLNLLLPSSDAKYFADFLGRYSDGYHLETFEKDERPKIEALPETVDAGDAFFATAATGTPN